MSRRSEGQFGFENFIRLDISNFNTLLKFEGEIQEGKTRKMGNVAKKAYFFGTVSRCNEAENSKLHKCTFKTNILNAL